MDSHHGAYDRVMPDQLRLSPLKWSRRTAQVMRSSGRRVSVGRFVTAVVAFGLALLNACTPAALQKADDDSAPSAPPASLAPAKLVPSRGAYLGVYYGTGTVEDTIAKIGVSPKIHLTYFTFSDDWVSAESTKADFAANRIPLINWEPFDVDFDEIIEGKYDALVAQRAAAAATLPGQFFLDFAAEMNEQEGWGGHSPSRYIAAWRHVHDIFVEHGATNAVWVWAPNNTDSDGGPAALDYYPGDEYVDWTGIDGYNWGTSKPEFDWQSFDEVFGPLYDQLEALDKPVIIGETASDEVGGSKAEWITDIVPQLQSRFSSIRAVVWFDIRKERRWQIDSSAESLSAFRQMASDAYFER